MVAKEMRYGYQGTGMISCLDERERLHGLA